MISPRFTEYGKSNDMKNGWNTCRCFGCFVKPRPLIGSNENPVITHDVIESGTFLWTVWRPSYLFSMKKLNTLSVLYSLQFHIYKQKIMLNQFYRNSTTRQISLILPDDFSSDNIYNQNQITHMTRSYRYTFVGICSTLFYCTLLLLLL